MEIAEKPSYHHKDLKRMLIEKGIVMISEDGTKDFSLRKLAVACGVSHAAPYSHFSNKEEFLKAVQEYITEQFAICLEEVATQHSQDPDVLLYLGQSYVSFFMKHPSYFSFLYTKSEVKIDLTQIQEIEHNYRPYEIFKKAANSVLEQFELPQEQKKDLMISMWTFVHGIASVATMKNVVYDQDWDSKIMDYLKMFQLSQ